jgi:nucleotide-binding universal stress UspA family protein
MVFLRKILVTTDLSPFSLAAVEHASSFGLLYGAELSLLFVAETDSRKFHRGGEQGARKALAEFAAKNIHPDAGFVLVVRAGSPAEVIARFAEEESIDLVVMATHGRGAGTDRKAASAARTDGTL